MSSIEKVGVCSWEDAGLDVERRRLDAWRVLRVLRRRVGVSRVEDGMKEVRRGRSMASWRRKVAVRMQWWDEG
jgi:hypothetical protein